MRYRISTFDRIKDFTTFCEFQGVVDETRGRPKVLVTLDPPFPNEVFATLGRSSVTQLVLAPRHQGVTLVPRPSELPCHVHMCVPREGGTWTDGPYSNLEWGLLEDAVG